MEKLKLSELENFIGKKIFWDTYDAHHKYTHNGYLEEIEGKNITIDGDPKWFPDMRNVRIERNSK